jgi:hypothetical protein
MTSVTGKARCKCEGDPLTNRKPRRTCLFYCRSISSSFSFFVPFQSLYILHTMADGFVVPPSATPETDAQHRLRGPIHAQRHVRVVCIGAGASGLLMAYKLQKHFSNYSLQIYEKNAEVSGTWYEVSCFPIRMYNIH